jgi:hypothetical protein
MEDVTKNARSLAMTFEGQEFREGIAIRRLKPVPFLILGGTPEGVP